MGTLNGQVADFYSRDPVVASRATEQLVAGPDPVAVIEVVVPLQGAAQAVRLGTQRRLAQLTAGLGPAVIPHLGRCLAGGGWNSKMLASACYAGLKDTPEAQAPLLAIFEAGGDFDAERLAVEAMGRLGADGWAWNIDRYACTGRWSRVSGERDDDVSNYPYGKLWSYALVAQARFVARGRGQDTVATLFGPLDTALRRSRERARNVSPNALSEILGIAHEFTVRSVDPLIDRWGSDPDAELQKLCMDLLGRIAPLRASAFLMQVATDSGRADDVRLAASIALGEIRTQDTAERVAQAMAEADDHAGHLGWAATNLMAAGGDWSGSAAFVQRTLDGGGEPAAQLSYSLAVRGDDRCRAALVQGLSAATSFERWTSALALARLLGPASLPHLEHRAADAADDLERAGMLAALIRAGAHDRATELQQALQALGLLAQLRSIWRLEMLEALRLAGPEHAGAFEAWRQEALVSERALLYFQKWGRPALAPAPSPVLAVGGPALAPPVPPRVFISYSQRNKPWMKRFQTMLSPLQRNARLDVWDDSRIKPGKWRPQIEAAMRDANVALFLVSQEFLASEFVACNELPDLLRMAEERGLKIVWVLLNPCFWDQTALRDYQSVNAKEPLNGLKAGDRDRLILQACTEVLNAAG